MCGGMGTRLKEETEYKPKPMVEIGGRPILWHIMKHYTHFGFNNFILCLGYRGAQIKDYFLNHRFYTRDFRYDSSLAAAKTLEEDASDDFKIIFADTGLDTLTGERLLKIEKYLPQGEFMLTYGDGLSDVNLRLLLTFYQQKKSLSDVYGVVTGIHPKSKYGLVTSDPDNIITFFQEKPTLPDYTNGGFMVLNRNFLRYCKPKQMVEEALTDAAKDRRLALYQHEGFWHCMDTYKDKEDLEKMWATAPKWKLWN
ncbi:MAG: sugar phosphate nucleotidyltransferase [bacterium]